MHPLSWKLRAEASRMGSRTPHSTHPELSGGPFSAPQEEVSKKQLAFFPQQMRSRVGNLATMAPRFAGLVTGVVLERREECRHAKGLAVFTPMMLCLGGLLPYSLLRRSKRSVTTLRSGRPPYSVGLVLPALLLARIFADARVTSEGVGWTLILFGLPWVGTPVLAQRRPRRPQPYLVACVSTRDRGRRLNPAPLSLRIPQHRYIHDGQVKRGATRIG